MPARRQLQQIAIPSRAEISRINAEAEAERRRVAYEAGRLSELFGQVLEVISRRKKPDDDQCDDQ